MQTSYTSIGSTRRPSWRGILAGLLMGIVVSIIMIALALVIGSFLSLDLRGAGVAAGIYTAITALISAFVAGWFAVKASAPETLIGDGTDISAKDATLTGILTAAAIVVITTVLTMNGMSSAVRTAGTAIGSTTSALGSAVGTATVGLGGAVATAANSPDVKNKAEELYQRATGNISRQDIESWIAKNSDALNKQQVSAVAGVFEQMLNETKQDAKAMDFTNLDTWKNLDEYAKQRIAEIEQTLNSDEIIARLQAEGLTQDQAVEVRNEVNSAYQEYKAQTEQAINDTKAKVEQTLQDAEDAARKTALYSGLFGLISIILTFLASIMGAKKAAASYPVVRRQV